MIFDIREVQKIKDHLNTLKGYIEIKQVKNIRSIDQNRLYWLWLSCISQETGNDKDYLHDHFKGCYLESPVIELKGKKIHVLGSTKTLDTNEFTKYLEKIQVFSNTELGINLPNPDDVNFKEFLNHYKRYM